MITIDVEPYNFRQPFYATARELIGRGYSPDEKLQMRHANGVIGLTGNLGAAAKRTVNENRW